MPDTKYSRDTQRMDCLGLDLNRPVDSTKPGKFPLLKNVRSYQSGRIEPRYGITNINGVVAAQTPVHSARRLNDPFNNSWTRIIGAGTHLAYGQTSFTDADSNYSGEPLALVPYRPDQAPDAWMYVADRLRMRKVSRPGAVHTIGMAPPAAPPTAALAQPQYKVIDEFDSTAGWGQAGTAGAPTLLSAGPGFRTTTTITRILYDTGTTGWCSINPASMANIGPGERLTLNPGGGTDEIATVQAVFPGSVATTIGQVLYDTGTTGLCSIILATPISQVARDALARDVTVGEQVRILSVTEGPDDTMSLRVETAGTFAAGDTFQVLPSFRIYTANNHAAAETVRTDGVRSVVTVGTGTLTRTAAFDLSLIATGVPALPDDYMHISIRTDRPDLVTEGKVELDVDISTNDFTRNYFSKSFRSSDLTPSARNLQSLVATRQQIIQRTIIDTPLTLEGLVTQYGGGAVGLLSQLPTDFNSLDVNTQVSLLTGLGLDTSAFYTNAVQGIDASVPQDDTAVSQQLGVGDNQWTELRFPLSDLLRIGTDLSRTLQNVAAIRITLITTGTVTIDLDSWWIGGGYGPDVQAATGIPYVYRYRVRVPATGAKSNWSPAMRTGQVAFRQKITVGLTQYAAPSGTTLVTGDMVLDVQRFGGEVASWHYVGTAANGATPSFDDTFPDDTVATQESMLQTNWQPWPVIDIPRSGTAAIVAGTTISDAGGNFNTSWAPGTEVKIKGVVFTIYRVVSTTRLELVENAGSQTAVSWVIDEPILMAQPLACLWGSEEFGGMFACGDVINPGRLYYGNPNDPDATKETNYVDITSPSEPLMNGVIYNVRSYVFSSERMFQILPDQSGGWYAQEIPNGKGLFARWALTRTPSPVLAVLGKDGIYATGGGEGIAQTDADLYPLFPNEGNLGQPTNGIPAPNIIASQQQYLRLEYYDGYLYFDYKDTDGDYQSLVQNFDLGSVAKGEAPGGWFYDIYTPGAVFHYGEEGPNVHSLLIGGSDATTGHLYQYAGNSDNGTPIACQIRTPSRDQGDPRENKFYGDILLDADTAGVNVTATPGTNNYSTPLTPVTINTTSREQVAIPLGTGWVTARNIALDLSFSVDSAAKPLFYIWEPRWTFEAAPISAQSWEISATTFGMPNWKHMGLVRITHLSTTPLKLIVTLDGVQQPAITIPASGGIYKQDVFRVPVWKAKIWQIRVAASTPGDEVRLDTRDTFFQLKEWGDTGPYRELRVFGDYALVEG